MEQKRNYQKEMERITKSFAPGDKPRLLLHSCCAPCSSAVLETVAPYFALTVYYYNPNIAPREEYQKRVEEQKRLLLQMPLPGPVDFLEGPYEPDCFLQAVKGLEMVPEGGARCEKCFRLRLRKAAEAAKEGSFDFFTTTLTVSPLKNAPLLNQIGEEMAAKYGVRWLPSDFKKKEGYKRSITLSHQYGLYRQDYCGCAFSKRERMEEKRRREQEGAKP
ncbi:MAG TPA: epoxyqueuosine reductase QueH [Firmicutes bacterium]|nr:epoxyqueuosine reductase QueH [Bacillota bacterium]